MVTDNFEKPEKLQQRLEAILSGGIQADKAHLKRDMCAQFANPHEWIREYVVNALDAGASLCSIRGSEDEAQIHITVSDNGCGMSKKGILDFFMLFRSDKEYSGSSAIGRHGIGKLSVAAIPGQCSFSITTSTGKESWLARCGSLLSNDPISIQRIVEPLAEKGTTFRISFIKKNSLKTEMLELEKILKKYVCFLPMEIEIMIPSEETENEPGGFFMKRINQSWPGKHMLMYRSYELTSYKNKFTVVVGLGATQHAIFQHRVFISDQYNLVEPEEKAAQIIEGISIFVDSDGFELPFGRHKLKNEDILPELSLLILQRVLPAFYHEIYKLYLRGDLEILGFSTYQFDLLTSSLLMASFSIFNPWYSSLVLKCINHQRISFRDLAPYKKNGKKIYIADQNLTGIDFSVFDGPVLEKEQTGYCMELVRNHYAHCLIDLTGDAVVMEKPGISRNDLTDTERLFESSLGFQPVRTSMLHSAFPGKDLMGQSNIFDDDPVDTTESRATREWEDAQLNLQQIRWRVSRLVNLDGVTPNKTHLFLFTKETIVLNLHHPDIDKLLRLTKSNPELAGHWAMSLALSDKSSIMKHLTPETREELLVLDALSKISGRQAPEKITQPILNNRMNELILRIRRDMLN
ncbi:MAG TPA: ATP-binding protein [Prolixibacteraceae bacterium]|nr:ATP-binding protein [Prolixibacteraceae bacterium]